LAKSPPAASAEPAYIAVLGMARISQTFGPLRGAASFAPEPPV